jgi:hypothetical protein
MSTDNGEWESLVRDLLVGLRQRLGESRDLREWVGRLGALLVEEARSATARAAEVPPERGAPADDEITDAPPPVISAPQITGPRETILPVEHAKRMLEDGLGRGRVVGEPAGTAPARDQRQVQIQTPADLRTIADRAELKADASIWCIRRNQLSFEEIREDFGLLRERANTLPPCYLWMLDQITRGLSDDAWQEFEGCYRNLATAARLTAEAWETNADLREPLDLLAEAQSAVWSALQATDLDAYERNFFDKDQLAVFNWCTATARERRLHIDHLSADRAAAPTLWRGLAARLEAERERAEELRRRGKLTKKALDKVRYHAVRLPDSEPEEVRPNWDSISEGVERFVEAGGQPSDVTLVELLTPIAETLPDDYPCGAALAKTLEYVDARLALAEQEQDEVGRERIPTPELLRVRELLRGRVVVLIGGNCRPKSKSAIERELELKELLWLESRPHESLRSFEPAITRPETALVLLAIRWSSHSFEDIQEVCIAHDKPFVRLPGGYSPNQLAYQINRQQGQRLAQRLSGAAAG